MVAGFLAGNPLVVSFLITTFAIMQPEWRDTVTKAWQRVAGALVGAAVLALVVWLLPAPALLPIALVALLIGFPLQQTQPMIFNGCIVLMTVGMNATTKHLDPATLLVEYVGLILLAVAIGLIFGFAAVPGVPKPPLRRRFSQATTAVRDALTEVATVLHGEKPGRELGIRLRAATRTYQDLLTPEPGSRKPAPDQQAALDEATEGLRGIAASTMAMLFGGKSGVLADFAGTAAKALEDGRELEAPAALDDEQRLIADLMIADVLRIQHAKPILAR